MTHSGFMYNAMMASRSVLHRRKQYISLLAVCVVGVGISAFSIFLVSGMLRALSDKARIYYGGDAVFTGGTDYYMDMENAGGIIRKLEPIFGRTVRLSPRYDFDGRHSKLYFEGSSVMQRTIKGVDFAREQDLFADFNFVAGSAADCTDSSAIMVSRMVAEELGLRCGDTLTFLTEDIDDFIVTAPLTVRAIFTDSSVFGMYTSYVDRSMLLELYGRPDDWANRICIRFADKSVSERRLRKYHDALEDVFAMYPLVQDKEQFYDALKAGFPEQTYALLQLDANLQDVQFLADAMECIALAIIVVLLTIIAAGIGSTYRVLVMKRINEIGTYRALGMSRAQLTVLFAGEVVFLTLFGCAGGFLLAALLSTVIHGIDFGFIPAFDMFLANSRLSPVFAPLPALLLVVAVCVTTTLAVLFAIRKALGTTPAQALATTE